MNIESINFEYNEKISMISKKQFDVHIELYKGYVTKTNEIGSTLTAPTDESGRKTANATYSKFRGLKRGESYALDGVILHELYFANIGGSESPSELALKSLSHHFGSYDDWKQDMLACGNSARGWVITGYDPRTKSIKNICLDSHHDGMVLLLYPIIVLDMYEHAYFIDYTNKKDDYIHAFLKNINWYSINERFKIYDQVRW